jgi:hypothetical protein
MYGNLPLAAEAMMKLLKALAPDKTNLNCAQRKKVMGGVRSW